MLNKTFLVLNKEIKETKQGKPYITLMLCDPENKNVTCDGKIWSEKVENLNSKFNTGDVIEVLEGKEETYKNTKQININNLKVLVKGKWGFTTNETKTFYDNIIEFIDQNITDEHIKAITLVTFQKYSGNSFIFEAPAAKTHHHNYPGGLLKHTLELCRMALAIYNTELYPDLNWNIIYGACILHDLGKIEEYRIDNGNIEVTNVIKLTGHLVTTPLEIYDTAKMLGIQNTDTFNYLLHAVIAHHGKKEFGSPQSPETKEAWMVHLLDMISSQIGSQIK